VNVGQARVEVRERGVAELIDLALRFTCAFGGRLYLRLFLVTALPAWGICWWALSGDDPDVASVWALALALFALVQVPFTIAASRLMFAEAPSLREVLAASWKALWRSIWTAVAGALLITAGALTIVFAPAALARCLYVSEITLLEGTGVSASFSRSARFIRSRIWHAMVVWAALAVIALAFTVTVEIVASALTHDVLGLDMLEHVWEAYDSPAALFGFFVSLPFVTSARFLAYIDGRTRREAWDVQVRFLKLGLDEQAKAA
jgi:hypothetical protein